MAMQPVRRSKSLPCDRKRKVAPSLGPATRTAARSKCLLLLGGGKRGAGHSKRKDSAEGAVVVVDAHPPRTPHDHMDRITLRKSIKIYAT